MGQSDGTDGARYEHGALALEATEEDPANAGAAGYEDDHGSMANLEGTGTEEEGDETLQRALSMQSHNGGENEARVPLDRTRALNACDC